MVALSSDDNIITMNGEVTLIINSASSKIKLDNGAEIIAVLSGKMKLRHQRLYSGDRVKVEISTYDLTKGRIIDYANK